MPEYSFDSPDPGWTFAGYSVVLDGDRPKRLGPGGTGITYLAQNRSGRLAALKLFKPDSEIRNRLKQEVAALRALARKPTIVGFIASGSAEKSKPSYLLTEYRQDAKSLHARLTDENRHGRPVAKRPESLKAALRWAVDLSYALQELERARLVHRDIKPSNVIVEPIAVPPSPPQERAVLIDFGLALHLDGHTLHPATDYVGTPPYSAPEQLESAGTVGHPADYYSFGATLYQVLTGERPYATNNPKEALEMKSGPPQNFEFHTESWEPRLRSLVTDLLMVDPRRRPKSAQDIIDRLDELLWDCFSIQHRPATIIEPARHAPPWVSISASIFGQFTEVPGFSDVQLADLPLSENLIDDLLGGRPGSAESSEVELMAWPYANYIITQLNAHASDPAWRYDLPTRKEWEAATHAEAHPSSTQRSRRPFNSESGRSGPSLNQSPWNAIGAQAEWTSDAAEGHPKCHIVCGVPEVVTLSFDRLTSPPKATPSRKFEPAMPMADDCQKAALRLARRKQNADSK